MDLGDRFWSKVAFDVNGRGCWTWAAALKPAGYGHYRIDNVSFYSHRLAFEELVGPIPDGLVLDHLCSNRACCNPCHLEPVTNTENIRRAPNRHREKTHCPQGHPYSQENTYVRYYSGHRYRYCVTCCKARSLATYNRSKAQ